MMGHRFITRLFRLNLLVVLFLIMPITAEADRDQYLYDDLGRLQAVIDAQGNAAIYHYDAAGNLLSITRNGAGQVAILSVSPLQGIVGSTVIIKGVGFSAMAGQNQVAFGGNAQAVVSSATTTRITTTVPGDAVTGPITVTTPSGAVVSQQSFKVLPLITSITPGSVVRGSTIGSFTINGTKLTGATTVAFSPSTGITVQNPPAVNSAGTTATVQVSISASAPTGGRLVTITTAAGSSESVMTAANTFGVLSQGAFAVSPLLRLYVAPPPDAIQHLRVFVEPVPNPILSPLLGVQVNPP
jgi:YD repeat-containing protein